ncbi:unnamed protein product [Rotaria sordida]|uniref:Uncharacterized protein n=1 Tax=Rotaria sordida TaxID=392033 RepID=A0A813QSH8_9BILA|nr:unnamed protein product [Rotaria sordida]CAF0782775.1 unnamed protein product [Rotaria sordida]CAF0793930.1 unnamed protein product [Rotaria sordida]CAF0878461.1 unnamed protein product [Rotaria sordida]CAF3616385.1 unnamed protein product [Rotaria sordida]
MCSSYVIVLLSIVGFVLTNPVRNTFLNEKPENLSLTQAFNKAEKAVKRYSYLINSDTDHLVHGILHILMKNPTLFTLIPRHAVDIIFDNIAEKLGYDDVETITTPILLSIEQNYQKKGGQTTPIELTDETKEKIEEALDNFLDGEFQRH